MKTIIVSVTNDLSIDQRVAKTCNTLTSVGFNVILIGRKLKNSTSIKRSYETKRIKLFFNNGFLFYAEYNIRLFFFLLFSKKSILLANDLDTLLPNFLVSIIQNKKIVFDSHELFSEVPELVNKPRVKKTWLFLEKWIIPKLKNNYTVCQSIANYYQEKYNSKFEVIKNLPVKKTLSPGQFPFDKKDNKVILYQGAVNIGRGLELMIDTMSLLENHILVIIGSGDILKQLELRAVEKNLSEKIIFLGKMNPKKLQEITPLADLGISLEEDLGLNYRYALPNKIFDYIQAEIPVLVSNLPEMKKIVTDFSVGEIGQKRNAKDLAIQIKNFRNKKHYQQYLEKAKKELVWENQEEKLLQFF